MFPRLLKVVIMFEEVCSQEHCSEFAIKFTASLKDSLERTIPLISMSSVKNLVVGVDSSLQDQYQMHMRIRAPSEAMHSLFFRVSRIVVIITCIWSFVIRASSSFSRPVILVLKAFAIMFRSTERKGSVYWMSALLRICSYRVST